MLNIKICIFCQFNFTINKAFEMCPNNLETRKTCFRFQQKTIKEICAGIYNKK